MRKIKSKNLTAWVFFIFIFLIVTLSHFHWYPGSDVVLDCIDSWSLPSFLLLLDFIVCSQTKSGMLNIQLNNEFSRTSYPQQRDPLHWVRMCVCVCVCVCVCFVFYCRHNTTKIFKCLMFYTEIKFVHNIKITFTDQQQGGQSNDMYYFVL